MALTLWVLPHDREIRAFQALGVFADGSLSGNRKALESVCAH